ncbi:hypothetical protein D8674_018744 [Pyrus ussuriensis x Pyrus communis]|uniref:Transmembrane protein n=1 Tax=Pyrus ussuriensis x Pyrus communis TaxID=2448454 RepID=A0A5N5GB96_9ROSA|nr:hypothetical protein D8674_018744 [Pyrus ussuriensis x Pyrus communis]
MDYLKISSIQSAINQFNFKQSHKVIKFLLSVSVFSVLLSYSSLIPFSLHSFNSFTSSVNFFSYTFDKKYVFLLCNGLLVFIVKNSGLAGTSPRESSNLNNNDHVPKSIESGRKAAELEETKVTEAPQAKEEVSNVEMEQTKVREDEILVSEEEEKRVLITVEEEDECCRNNFALDDHDMYEEEGIEVLSAEELNKKCDDFIRRMKEGIKLEAQQQPITF